MILANETSKWNAQLSISGNSFFDCLQACGKQDFCVSFPRWITVVLGLLCANFFSSEIWLRFVCLTNCSKIRILGQPDSEFGKAWTDDTKAAERHRYTLQILFIQFGNGNHSCVRRRRDGIKCLNITDDVKTSCASSLKSKNVRNRKWYYSVYLFIQNM